MTYLFYTCVNISDKTLNWQRQKTVNCTHVHSDPIPNIFNAINKYSTMAKAHSIPKTQEHLISIIKIIIITENDFAGAVEKWNAKPSISQTWTNFKSHFAEAQSNYNKVQPSDTLSYHSYIREVSFS